MSEISKVRNKWKFIGLAWFLVFILGWLAVLLPDFSVLVLKGLMVFSLLISLLTIFFWPKLEWHIILLLGQIIPLEFLILSIRSTLLLPPFWAYIFIAIIFAGYIGVFFLPTIAPRTSYLMVYGNPESKTEKKIFRLIIMGAGIASACGASAGIFGGRVYGMKTFGVIGPVIGLVAIFFAHLTFYNLWQRRPWITPENRDKS